ncbi:hypothetical protein EDB84DRAFT_1462987, partial [Lactarius hengduanensis]
MIQNYPSSIRSQSPISTTTSLLFRIQSRISLDRIQSISLPSAASLWGDSCVISLSRQKEDLDKSILHCTESILLLPVSWATPPFHVTRSLFLLATALIYRTRDFNQTEDVKYSIEYLRYLRGLPLDKVRRKGVVSMLIEALGAQAKSGTGDGTRNIGEMVVLCRELLTSHIPENLPTPAFTYLTSTVL